MKVLLIGQAGREHALAWQLAGSPILDQLWISPGNAGTVEFGINIGFDDESVLIEFCVANAIDLVVIGPEAPLVSGLADRLRRRGVRTFGPGASAARLEGEKSFMKALCQQCQIPTADWRIFTEAEPAHVYLDQIGAPVVVKADGLAAGKGVVVADTTEQAHQAVQSMLVERSFGQAGTKIIIEEKLEGQECSFFALCHGKDWLPLASACDYKRVGHGDTGPNTGGMGACSPAPITVECEQQIEARILQPLLEGLAAYGADYQFQGILFLGLMVTEDGPRLLECNVRFGDPECQTMLMRLQSDLLTAMLACCDGGLDHFDLRWDLRPSVTIVLAADGYPGSVLHDVVIPDPAHLTIPPDVRVFHAGTDRDPSGRLIVKGGRVFNVTAIGADLDEARGKALGVAQQLVWKGGFYRTDIGQMNATEKGL